MNSPSGTITSQVWRNLPDPRGWREGTRDQCVVHFTLEALGHIIERHMTNEREPWDEWLSPEHVAHLVQVGRSGFPGELAPDAFEAVAGAFERAARAGMERPLVLLSVSRRPQAPPEAAGRASWMLVTPRGAVLVIRPRRDRLVTGYFPQAACREHRPDRRWRSVVQALIRRYCKFTDRGLAPPVEADVVPIRDSSGTIREFRTQIQFVTPTAWGFSPELDGSPWRGRLGDWPDAPTPILKTRRHRLKPRRSRRNEDSHG